MTISKLILLNRRQWHENKKSYYIGMLAIAGILLFLFILTWHFRDTFQGDTNRGIFLMGLFIGGGLFAASLLKDVKQPSRGMWLIGIPASAGEKLLIAILYSVIVYLLFYLPVFYILEGFFQWVVREDISKIERVDLLKNGFYYFVFTFIISQLLILMGCLSFRKAAFLKTILLMIAWFAISNNLNNRLLAFMTGEKNINGSALFDYFQFVHSGENVYVNLSKNTDTIVGICFNYLLPLVLCYINYLKLKETEL